MNVRASEQLQLRLQERLQRQRQQQLQQQRSLVFCDHIVVL